MTPTIDDMRKLAPWFWAHCTAKCGNRAALPWAAVVHLLPPSASANRLRAALRCMRCGVRGAGLSLNAPSDGKGTLSPIPFESVPAWARPWAEADYPPGPPGHGCTSFTVRRPPAPVPDALERRRAAIVARWGRLRASTAEQPTRADVREFIAVARALGHSEERIEQFARHFPKDWWQYPYRRPTWREVHDMHEGR